MEVKWKAFGLWLTLPYLFAAVIFPGMLLLFRHDIAPSSWFRWRDHVYVLVPCALTAGLGTTILWLLSIRRAWVGTITGSILAAGGIALWVKLRMTVFGGFESNAGTATMSLILLLPSCLAGAYAGWLRSREQPAEKPR